MEANERQSKILRTSLLGIAVNLLLAAAKITIGLLVSSLAIVSEGINNASDVGSSFMTLVGTKLSTRHPDEKHPFGYGRVEYLSGLVVGGMILFAALSLVRESVDALIHPGEMAVTVPAIIIVAVSAVVKLVLGTYTLGVGNKTDSDALRAVGKDCRNDSYLSVITVFSSLLFLFTGKSIDAIVGLLFAVVIFKAGFETLRDTVSDLIGVAGEEELARKIYREIIHTEGVLGAADMMLHDYGPDRYSGSVNIEVDHNKTIGELYETIHALQLRIMHEYHVTMVFGMYAVDQDSPEHKEMRRYIGSFVGAREHVKSFHALYLSQESDTIYVDLIVDYELKEWDALKEEFLAYMREKYPNPVELTIETEFV